MNLDNNINGAAALFSHILRTDDIGERGVAGVKESLKVKHMTHPLAWLPQWMLLSDELSVVLTGSRLWDCVYKANKGSVEGFTADPPDEFLEDDTYKTYLKHRSFSADDIPISLRYQIAKKSLHDSLEEKEKKYALKPLSGFYRLTTSVENGNILPFSDQDLLTMSAFNRMICSFNRKRLVELTNEKARKLDQSPSII